MLIIDRFEGDYAVIEYNNSTFDLPRSLLPNDAKEGDVLNISITIDQDKTKQQKENVTKLMEDLFE